LHVRDEVDQVFLRLLVGEGDHGAVDDEPDGPVCRATGSGEQVRSSGGEVEDLVLVSLQGVETLLDGLVGPLPYW
jgi:hypothetical protein